MGKTYDVGTQDATPRGLFMRPGGSMFFMVGNSNDDIFRYSLSTNYDISSSGFDTGNQYALQAGDHSDLHFKADGTKFWTINTTDDTVEQYTLTTAWDLSGTVTYNGSYDTSSEDAAPQGVSLSDDGTRLYVFGTVNNVVYEYELTTAYDVTGTVTYNSNNFSVTSYQNLTNTIHAYNDGSDDRIWFSDFYDVESFTMSTSWDITSASYDTGKLFSYTEQAGNCYNMMMSDDGDHFYVVDAARDVYQYDMGTSFDQTTAYFDPPIASDGAVSISPTASGTADTHHAYADGAVSVTPTVSGTATNNTIHADGAVSITPTMASTARGTPHAAGAVSIAPEVAGEVSVPPIGLGEVSITPTVEGTGDVVASMRGDMTFPAMTAEGWIEYSLMSLPLPVIDGFIQNTNPSSVTLPALTATGQMHAGDVIYGDVTLPALQVEAATDNQADITLPSLTATASMISSNVYVGSMTLPPLEAYGGTEDQRFLSGEVTLPVLTMRSNSIMVSTGLVIGSMTLPLLKTFGVNAGGSTSAGDMVLPIFTMENLLSQLISAGILSADLTLPSVEAQAYIQIQVTLTHSGWAINTENMLTSEYDNFNYLLLTKAFGKHIGVAADGVYELTGDSDNTVDINADVLFGFDSFRTEDLKRVKTVHLGYRADNSGDLSVQIVVDGEDKIREYSVRHVSSASGIKRGRATIAKGLKSRYWKYGVKNVAGADFLIDDLSVYVQQHNRKAQ